MTAAARPNQPKPKPLPQWAESAFACRVCGRVMVRTPSGYYTCWVNGHEPMIHAGDMKTRADSAVRYRRSVAKCRWTAAGLWERFRRFAS